MAEGVATLLQMLRSAGKEADTERGKEKAPYWDAGKAVDAKWKPLAELVTLATTSAKSALQPYLKKKADEKAEADRIAREEAETKRRRAEELFQSTQVDDLASRAVAEAVLKDAKKMEAAAARDAKKTAGVSGKVGKAVSLKTTYKAILVDPEAALEHFWPSVELEGALTAIGQRLVKSGARNVPGFEVKIEKETF